MDAASQGSFSFAGADFLVGVYLLGMNVDVD